MNNFLPTILGTAAIVIVQSQVTLAQSIDEVEAIAERITVKIESAGSPGSGVIIGKKGKTYYVLTARHVLDKTISGEEAYVNTYDGNSYLIDTNKLEKLPNSIDLLLLQFESDRDYPIATISEFNYRLHQNNDYEHSSFTDASSEQSVFVSGWPLKEEEEEDERVFSPGILFDNSGTAISYQPDTANEDSFGGYELIYTNLTHPGMSGGPVLDTQGRLIAIHGRADGRKIGEEDEIEQDFLNEVGSPLTIKIGLSLGIPIQSFLSWAANHEVFDSLTIEETAPPPLNQRAVNDWRPVIKVEDTQDPYHWLEKGNQLWRIGRVAEARDAFIKANELYFAKNKQEMYLAWFAKGFADGFDQKFDLALEACEKAIQLQVTPSRYKYEAYRCKAGALKELQQYEPALASLNTAIALNDQNPADWLTQGELKYALGEYQGAVESLNKAIELRKLQNLSPSTLMYNNRGFVRLELKQYELALQDVETALKIDPNYVPAWNNKGLILETMEQNEASLQAYDRATELDSNDYTIWTNRGFVLYKLKRYQEAKKSLETALKINPEYQPAINSLEQLMLETEQ
jgi:tetratricopeptide (TPR) repeat protein